jgi:hypothetical protein
MKNSLKILVLFAISLVFVFTSCTKDNASSKDDIDMLKSATYEEADFMLEGDGDFEKVITKPLKKIEDCKFIVEGTIEFRKEGEIIVIIDFGDGECDDIATKTVDGESVDFSMKKEGDKEKYYKVITSPIVRIEGCDYIVSGVVEFYSYKDDSWLANIDFGDGTCDEWATKTWDGGSKEFSMKDWLNKEKP